MEINSLLKSKRQNVTETMKEMDDEEQEGFMLSSLLPALPEDDAHHHLYLFH